MAETARTLITNASLLDPERATVTPDSSVLVEGDRIADVGPRLSAQNARIVDAGGRTVMPGLIDCHVHLIAAGAHLGEVAEWSPIYVAAHAGQIARGMLRRGFTTVRDAGGADYGLAQAIEEGLFEGPRLIFGGAALSQTGGHGDLREAGR